MTNEEYKKLSIKEFTKAAGIYEGDKAGIYEMCKKDYPDIFLQIIFFLYYSIVVSSLLLHLRLLRQKQTQK